MTLATRCSRCHTVFRLDQAALNAAEGWVRCGRCREVFNAIEALFEPKPVPTGAEVPAEMTDAVDLEAAAIDAARASAGRDAVFDAGAAPDQEPRKEPSDQPAQPALGAADHESAEAAHGAASRTDEPPALHSVDSDSTAFGPAASEAREADPTPSETASTIPAALDGEDDARDLRAARMSLFGPDSEFDEDSRFDTRIGDDGLERMSLWSDTRPAPRRRTRRARPKAAVHRDDRDFELSETTVDVASMPMAMPSVEAVDHLIASNDRDTTFAEYEPTSGYEIASRPAHRRRPSMRLALRIAALALGVGLVLQSALHARDSIAAHWPATEPVLQSLCVPFGCEVEAPRDSSALQVQSVTFHEAGVAGLYELNVVLFNRSDLRVRMPALDLRISDARGDVAARRVLTAAEMEYRERSIAPRSEAALAASLRIDQPNVSGYEVTVFYP